MADVSALMQKLFARALLQGSPRCQIPQYTNADIKFEAAKPGDTINVPRSQTRGTQPVTPGFNGPAPVSYGPTTVPVTLDKHEQADPFDATAIDMTRVDIDETYVPMAMSDSMLALRKLVTTDLYADYWRVYHTIGSAGTTPFATNQLQLAAQIGEKFDALFAPGKKFAIIDGLARINALSTADFVNADKRGSDGPLKEGEMGLVSGVNYLYDQLVPRHVSTPLTAGNATVNGAHSAGVTTISVAKASNASPLVRGDIITFAGDTQTYSVQAAVTLAVGNTSVTIEPPLAVAKSGGELMTLTASHRVNLCFVPAAWAFGNRESGHVAKFRERGANIVTLPDPVTGAIFTLEERMEYARITYHIQCLWGKRWVEPGWAFRLLGA